MDIDLVSDGRRHPYGTMFKPELVYRATTGAQQMHRRHCNPAKLSITLAATRVPIVCIVKDIVLQKSK